RPSTPELRSTPQNPLPRVRGPAPHPHRGRTMTTLPSTRPSPLAHRLAPYLLLAPAVLLVLVVLGYPMVRQLIMSFQEFGLAQQFGQAPEWVGLDNYLGILSDPYFWTVLAKSLAFCAWTAGLTMVFAVGFALLMRSASAWSRT